MELSNVTRGRRFGALAAVAALVAGLFVAEVTTGSAPPAAAAANAYITDNGATANTIAVGNSDVEIVINRSNGHFMDIWNKQLGYHFKKYNAGAWPLSVAVGTSASPTQYLAALTSTSGQTMTWSDVTGGATDRKIFKATYANLIDNTTSTSLHVSLSYTLTVLDTPSDGRFNRNQYFQLQATVTNNNTSTYKVYGVYAGDGGLVADGTNGWSSSSGTADGSRSNETMAIPDWGGNRALANPSGTLSGWLPYGDPGWSDHSLQASWFDLYSSSKGLGMGYVNVDGMPAVASIGSSSGSGIKWSLFDLTQMPNAILQSNASATYYGLDFSGSGANSWSSGIWVISPHSGDWHQMADAYSAVYHQTMSGNYTPSSDYPSSFSDIYAEVEFVGYGSLTAGGTPTVGEYATNADSDLAGFASAIGASMSNILPIFTGYHGNGTVGGHEYGHPAFTSWGTPAGTSAQVQSMIDGVISAGNPNPGVYLNMIGDYADADNIISGAYQSGAANGQHVLEYQTNSFQDAADPDTSAWQSWFQSMWSTFKSRGIGTFKFDQLPLTAGVTSLTSHVDVPNNILGTLTSDTVGRRKIVDYYWEHDPTFRPLIVSESGSDVNSGRSVQWELNGDVADSRIPSAVPMDEAYAHFTFPEKLLNAFGDSNLDSSLARLQIPPVALMPGSEPEIAKYVAMRQTMKATNAPGVPFGYRDTVGITNAIAGLQAYAFSDANGVTVSMHAASSVAGSITVNMKQLGFPTGPTSVTVPAVVGAGDFAFVTITPTGAVRVGYPAYNQINYEAESPSNSLAGTATVYSRSTDSNGGEVGYLGYGTGNSLTINGVVDPIASGNVPVTLTYLNGDNAARTADVSVNGGTPTTVSFPGLGSWATTGEVTVSLPLSQGSNTISFANPSAWAPNIDRILVNLPDPTRYEAESGVNALSGGAAVYTRGSPPDSGGAEVGFLGNGSTLTFSDVLAQATTMRQVVIGYLNGDSSSRTVYISVNGGSSYPVSCPGLGSWSTVGTVTLELPLAAGVNSLVFSNASAWAPNIDYLDVK